MWVGVGRWVGGWVGGWVGLLTARVHICTRVYTHAHMQPVYLVYGWQAISKLYKSIIQQDIKGSYIT